MPSQFVRLSRTSYALWWVALLMVRAVAASFSGFFAYFYRYVLGKEDNYLASYLDQSNIGVKPEAFPAIALFQGLVALPQGFVILRMSILKVFSSSTTEWSVDSALTCTSHPNLEALLIARVNTTNGELPPGLLSPEFPLMLADVEMSAANLRTLPDDLDTKWPPGTKLKFEYSAFTSIPDAVMRLLPILVSFCGNPIDEIPADLFAVESTRHLHLGDNQKLKAFPANTTMSTSLGQFHLQRTQIAFFPSWLDPVVNATLSQGHRLIRVVGIPYASTPSPYENIIDAWLWGALDFDGYLGIHPLRDLWGGGLPSRDRVDLPPTRDGRRAKHGSRSRTLRRLSRSCRRLQPARSAVVVSPRVGATARAGFADRTAAFRVRVSRDVVGTDDARLGVRTSLVIASVRPSGAPKISLSLKHLKKTTATHLILAHDLDLKNYQNKYVENASAQKRAQCVSSRFGRGRRTRKAGSRDETIGGTCAPISLSRASTPIHKMSRGRGRGRIRFGGSRDSALADMLDETREDLGLSHTQMELLHVRTHNQSSAACTVKEIYIVLAESGSALYPPLQLPQPEPLTDRDAYLIQRQRVLAHKLENLYHPWGLDATMPDSTNPAAFVHVTTPETQKASEVFVPNELQSNTLSGVRTANTLNQRSIMQPRAFENVFKSLEAQEQKQADKSKGAADDDDGDMEEQDEDLGDDMNDYTFDYYDSDAASEDGDEEVFF
ncbi:hypothetical protein FI667_g2933, partial [Globisporangium splendens]